MKANAAQAAWRDRRKSPFFALAAMFALMSMVAVGTGLLGHAHQQVHHDAGCITDLVSLTDEAAFADPTHEKPHDPHTDYECDLCDLITGSQTQMLAAGEFSGMLDPQASGRCAIEPMRSYALASEHPHFARPPPFEA